MKQEIKDKWINALLSGEYKQGWGYLKVDNEFCCLGVLCDLYSKETGVQWVKSDDRNNSDNYYNLLGSYLMLPDEVIAWADAHSYNPIGLSDMNDNGDSFSSISEFIKLTKADDI